MCDAGPDATASALTRRAFLRGAAAVALAVPLAPLVAGRAAAAPLGLPGVTVRPREDWAQGLAPTGPLASEQPGDVRFLLVHHTASGNGYGPEAVAGQIRSFYGLHTGPTKNWPDVAYNFFVDRHGGIWEGRAGSLAGPVQPDATGGSQGFAQLCCFIGDHTTEPPTAEARGAMVALLAALADVYGIDTTPGATTSFVSRGSNRWPVGTPVTAATISGHRDMSLTACPGDAAYPLVRDVFPTEVSALRAARSAPPPAPAPPPAELPAPSDAPPSTPVTDAPTGTAAAAAVADGAGDWVAPVLVSGAAVAATGAALAARHRRRSRSGGGPGKATGEPVWQVHEAGGDGTGALSAATVHERLDGLVVGMLVTADHPSTAVPAAHDAARRATREGDGQAERWRQDPARAAALLVSRSLNAGYAAVRGRRIRLDGAAVLVAGGTVTVAATDEAMAALLTVDGEIVRPTLDRPSGPGALVFLYRAARPGTATAAAVLVPVAPGADRGGAPAQRLSDLCRRLTAPADVDRALAGFRYDFYGATGTEAAALAVVRPDALPATVPGRR
ncbi:N-acetylmuramoyl-L-alanine amidase [Geodermatophilus sabuli]|uniref:N-acetylmuramoyl-L-alanine amidase n=1 Tax=Geodermatophilus sabuli TaxID=1564158 RepID=A0A285E7Q8_9ACTN|nr:N-acetylmuramoyl-L-alanine amidase [Geodermatophilus sabuli]MBB3082148.1 hypothetical protein [Geodermatophilus sabuli]SNX94980.1 N-acetylmuramoyl-L-alanine amidase [Geodermatophilus sabuli]